MAILAATPSPSLNLLPAGETAALQPADVPAAVFSDAVRRVDRRLAEAFDHHVPADQLVTARAAAVDSILTALWESRLGDFAGRPALVAVGGYGRGELHPASDIDILILLPDHTAAGDTDTLERFLVELWDIGLEIGQSVRTVEECVQQAAADLSVVTNLTESRLLAGDEGLFTAMRAATAGRAMWPARDFLEAKRAEQAARHHKFHDSLYNLEPNIKEGPGGLRDLQMVGWVLKRHFETDDLYELVSGGFLTDSEYVALMDGQAFLWKVRCGLHLLTGRAEERLLFDHQRALAERFGYRPDDHHLAVERFMKAYYCTVAELACLNEMLMALFDEVILGKGSDASPAPINERFRNRGGQLETTHERVFADEPSALLELFLVMQQHPELSGVSAPTIRQVQAHLHLIDEGYRHDPANLRLFLDILRQPHGITQALRRMHRYGVLGAWLPAFGAVEGQMQHDLFHVYTVDEHTLMVVRNLRRFTVPEFHHEFPYCSDLIDTLPSPELLYLAGLFHDIGKGRGGDHSELGARDAFDFCIRLGLTRREADFVQWLVKNHLIMSVTAQREDISDPEVVAAFADKMGDRGHLNYLYLLTVADIRGTNPTLWNDWKNALLWQLYNATLRMLRLGPEKPTETPDLLQETQEVAWLRLSQGTFGRDEVDTLWADLPEEYFLRHSPDEIQWQTAAILEARREGRDRLVRVRPQTHRGGTEVFVYATDRAFLFATATATLDRLGLSVLDARVITTASGSALDTFILLGEDDLRPVVEPARQREIERAMGEALAQSSAPPTPPQRLMERRLRQFNVPTEINYHTDTVNHRSIMEVRTGDRPGLLAHLALVIAHCGTRLQAAKVTTLGERAEDIFFLTDMDGEPLDHAIVQCLDKAIHDQLG